MMESGFEGSFPVVFFDGDATMDMGNVFIEPSLDFKAFRSIISQKIGVSPHQITIYFERGPVPLRPPFGRVGGGRRIPVTNKFNFASILSEDSCFFFVVSKRSRRVRRRKNKQSTVQSVGGLNYPEINSPGRFDLVGRNAIHPFGGANFQYAEQFPSPPVRENWYGGVDYHDYANQMRRALEVEKERYLMSLNLNSNVYSDLDLVSKMNNGSYGVSGSEITSEDGSSSFGGVSGDRAALVCDVCTSAQMEGQTAPFHWCKRDAVLTTVFRSPAGPIARPARNRVDPSRV